MKAHENWSSCTWIKPLWHKPKIYQSLVNAKNWIGEDLSSNDWNSFLHLWNGQEKWYQLNRLSICNCKLLPSTLQKWSGKVFPNIQNQVLKISCMQKENDNFDHFITNHHARVFFSNALRSENPMEPLELATLSQA